MRYVINTIDEQGIVGIQLKKWESEKKIEIIESSKTMIEIQASLEKVSKALETLKKVGYNSNVMKIYIHEETRIPYKDINKLLSEQENFLRQIGALKK
jgi:hypothetical protein